MISLVLDAKRCIKCIRVKGECTPTKIIEYNRPKKLSIQ